MKNYGLICFWKEEGSNFLKNYIAAYKDIEIHSTWLIDILNDMPQKKFETEFIVYEILYCPISDECDDYYYLNEIDVDPYKIIWDKSYVIMLTEQTK